MSFVSGKYGSISSGPVIDSHTVSDGSSTVVIPEIRWLLAVTRVLASKGPDPRAYPRSVLKVSRQWWVLARLKLQAEEAMDGHGSAAGNVFVDLQEGTTGFFGVPYHEVYLEPSDLSQGQAWVCQIGCCSHRFKYFLDKYEPIPWNRGTPSSHPISIGFSITHMLHVWNIYQHLPEENV